MKNSLRIFCLILFLMSFTSAIEAQEQGKVSGRLKSGLSVIFTSKTEPAGSARPAIGSIEITGENNVIHRAFIDAERGVYFGYEVVIEPQGETGAFKLTFKPLPTVPSKFVQQVGAAQMNLKRGAISEAGSGGSSNAERRAQQLAPLIALNLPKYPDPQIVRDGETLALDVLVNSQTGVKIIDLIKVTSSGDHQFQPLSAGKPVKPNKPNRKPDGTSSVAPNNRHLNPISAGGTNAGQENAGSENQQPADLKIDAIELKITASVMLVNGKRLLPEKGASGYGVSGAPLIWFYMPEHGRFILSLTPRDGYDFQKIGTIRDNRITFTLNGNQYDWVSSSRILAVGGGPWNLWVLHDPDYRPDVTLTREVPLQVGAAGRIEYLIKKNN